MFEAVAKIAAANPDCVTGFSVVRDHAGYNISFENSSSDVYCKQIRITETDLTLMSNAEQVLNHQLLMCVEALRKHSILQHTQSKDKE